MTATTRHTATALTAAAGAAAAWWVVARVVRARARRAPPVPPEDGALLTCWDAFADLYDRQFRLWSAPAHQALVSALELGAAREVLEVGCGAGHGLAAIRAELRAGAVLAASDFSGAMLARAAARAEAARATLEPADAQRLPRAFDARFCAAVANLVIHIVPDVDLALASLFGALRSGGALGASVWGARAASPLFTIVDDALAELRAAGALPAGPPPPAPGARPKRSNFHLGADDAALRRRFESAGFVDVVSWHVPCVWPEGQRGGGGATSAGTRFARAWLSSQLSTAKLMAELTPAQCSALEACVARRADAIMAAGAPIACDVVVVTARKP